jgi:uncharacterized protein YecE (DUF72 family)
MTELTPLFIGTSGWSYKHWADIFYPAHSKSEQYLEYYITQFDCVELNSSFYHLPLKATINGWMERTPPEFKFCPKLSRFITHQKRLINTEEALGKYFSLFDTMKSRLGPVLVQLPPGLKFERKLISDFLNLLHTYFSNYRFAFEVRHKSWIADEFFDLLTKYKMAYVIADSGRRFPYYEAVTADYVYMRFHGHEKLYASEYTEHDLVVYAEKIDTWLNTAKEVWVFFNNDFNGFAVKNAKRLKEIMNTD